MTKIALIKPFLLFTALLLPACVVDEEALFDDCVSVCRDHERCDGLNVDCQQLCDTAVEQGCDDAFVDVLECEADQPDTCEHPGGSPDCEVEREAYLACLNANL